MSTTAEQAAEEFFDALDADKINAQNAPDTLRQLGGGDELAGAVNAIIYLANNP